MYNNYATFKKIFPEELMNFMCYHFCRNFILHCIIIVAGVSSGNCQTYNDYIILKGKVIDENSQMGIPYVSIGISGTETGTASNAEGCFELHIDKTKELNPILFTSIGYDSLALTLKQLGKMEDVVISLTKRMVQLDPITVTSGYKRVKKYGHTMTGGTLFMTKFNGKSNRIGDNLGRELGMEIRIKNKRVLLKDFNFYISESKFDQLTFRLRFYSIKNHMPDTLIFRQDFIYKIESARGGWFRLELERYKLTANDNFIVALEWVGYEMNPKTSNPTVFVPMFINPLSRFYTKVGSQGNWIKRNGAISFYVTVKE